MTIDLATIVSLELIQNLQNAKSKESLYGLLNETLTPMGARLLRASILQPSTERNKLTARYNAVEDLTTKEDMFVSVRHALKGFLDADKVLTAVEYLRMSSESCANQLSRSSWFPPNGRSNMSSSLSTMSSYSRLMCLQSRTYFKPSQRHKVTCCLQFVKSAPICYAWLIQTNTFILAVCPGRSSRDRGDD
jgi:DNA mismatch repair ATPase MutS